MKDPAQRENYWQRLVAVIKELKALGPASIAPDTPEVVRNVSDERIGWRARTVGGRWYVFAYLPAEHFGERAT